MDVTSGVGDNLMSDRWRACEQHRDNTADKLLLTTVDMDCIEYWNLYSN